MDMDTRLKEAEAQEAAAWKIAKRKMEENLEIIPITTVHDDSDEGMITFSDGVKGFWAGDNGEMYFVRPDGTEWTEIPIIWDITEENLTVYGAHCIELPSQGEEREMTPEERIEINTFFGIEDGE